MGYTLLEVLMAICLVAILGSAAIPLVSGSVDQTRAAGAASYVASRMAMARFEAVRRSRSVAIRFTQNEEGYWLRTYADGNANGVLSLDIARGLDWPLTVDERLDYHFPGVTFGILPNVTNIDDGAPLDARDPIQIGSSTLLSFSPMGSSTSGTLFIRGQGAHQFAVRLLGSTGRARIFRFNFGDGTWQAR
jgi:type II secretory pathway pseudopilin PulG